MEKILKNFQEVFIKNKPNERIRILRRQKNFTIKQMAEKCVITEKVWSDWESGKAVPRKINQKRIARALGVDERTIFGIPEMCAYLSKQDDNVFKGEREENVIWKKKLLAKK